MPKRIVDGDALWTSNKLRQVRREFQAEYANLIPLALANGTFECDARLIWRAVYSYNRDHITIETVAAILQEFEDCLMLYRWQADDGKVYGYWIGIDATGRLPGPSRNSHDKRGPEVPRNALAQWLDSRKGGTNCERKVMESINFRAATNGQPTEMDGQPTEIYGTLGSGSGLGKGKGEGVGPEPDRYAASSFSSFPKDEHEHRNEQEQEQEEELGQTFARSNPVDEATQSHPVGEGEGRGLFTEPDDEGRSLARVRLNQHPLRDKDGPDWNALDFAFSREEEFAGFAPRQLQRVVWYHFAVLPAGKRFWANQGKVNSIARLEKMLSKMSEQVPEDFRVNCELYESIPVIDPNCEKCGGCGHTVEPDAFYDQKFGFTTAVTCDCVYYHPAPWRVVQQEAA